MFDGISDGIWQLLGLLAAVAGMAAFALANAVHWRQAFGPRRQTRSARALCAGCGAVLLIISFACCAAADPVSMAMLVWPMLLGVGGAVVAAFFTWRSQAGR